MGSFLDGNRTLSKKVIGVTSLVHLMYTLSISMQCSDTSVRDPALPHEGI
jgi:hypothetical protein